MAKAVYLKDIDGNRCYPAPYWPIGSIYISVVNTNPSKWFGGTWAAFGTGRCLVGVDTSQTEFNTVMKTGGEKAHTLTKTELPNVQLSVLGAGSTNGNDILRFGSIGVSTMTAGARIGVTEPMGNNQPHNNLQPYITVYMWRRTA